MIKKMVHRLFLTGFVAFFSSLSLMAQHKVEMVPMGGPPDKRVGDYRREHEECV